MRSFFAGQVALSFLALAFALAGAADGRANPNQGGGSGYTLSNGSSSRDAGGALPGWLFRRAVSARQLAGAVWRRFSPQWLAEFPPEVAAAFTAPRIEPSADDGASSGGWSIWKDSTFTHLRDASAGVEKGPSFSTTVALDRAITESAVLGLGVNHVYTRVKGPDTDDVERTRSFSASLFFNQQLGRSASLDLQAAYVHQRQRYRDFQPGGGLFTGRRRSNGYMLAGSLSAWTWVARRYMLSARGGVIATHDRWRPYTEYGPGGATTPQGAKSEALVQAVAEAGVSAWLDPFMPRFTITYTRDVYRKSDNAGEDRDDFTMNAGFTWYGSGALANLTLDVSGGVILGRKHSREWMLGLNSKWSW